MTLLARRLDSCYPRRLQHNPWRIHGSLLVYWQLRLLVLSERYVPVGKRGGNR